MVLKVLGSSSKGNCYLLENRDSCLILEAGIKSKEVLKNISFDLEKIVGVLVTHEHQDHAKYVNEWLGRGISVFMSEGTACKLKINSHNINIITAMKQFGIGDFNILPFEAIHDSIEPLNFLIRHNEIGKLIFATDTCYLKYRFNGLRNVLIEANYDIGILDGNDLSRRNRIIENHMSLETCISALKANDLSITDNVILIHLSDSNSDAHDFKKRVEEATGIETYIADSGLVLDLGGLQ